MNHDLSTLTLGISHIHVTISVEQPFCIICAISGRDGFVVKHASICLKYIILAIGGGCNGWWLLLAYIDCVVFLPGLYCITKPPFTKYRGGMGEKWGRGVDNIFVVSRGGGGGMEKYYWFKGAGGGGAHTKLSNKFNICIELVQLN